MVDALEMISWLVIDDGVPVQPIVLPIPHNFVAINLKYFFP